jgi:Exoribonuclease Xrn1 D1 domain
LHEAEILYIADEYFKYNVTCSGNRKDIRKIPQNDNELHTFLKMRESTEQTYSKKYGVLIGQVDILCRVRTFQCMNFLKLGMQLNVDGSLVKDFNGISNEFDVPLQTVVVGDHHEDPRYKV